MIEGPQRPLDERQVVRGVDKDGNLIFDQVGIEELNYRGRFGALATSGTERDISIGEHIFVLNQADDENLFRIGDDVLVTPIPSHGGCCMWAEVIAKDTDVEPCRITVHVEDISNIVGTFNNWELQVVARPKFGITKDTSASSVDPTADGPFTLTVTAGKFFPIGGKLLMIPLADRSIALVGLVKAYSGDSLVVEKNSTNATVSTSYTSWAIALLDAPQNKIPYLGITGLRITPFSSANRLSVSSGSVRDYADTVDLVWDDTGSVYLLSQDWDDLSSGAFGIAVKSANLAGTVTSAGAAVTGTTTSFLTNFGDPGTGAGRPSLEDFRNQTSFAIVVGGESDVNLQPIIRAGSVTSSVTDVASATALTTATNLGAAAATCTRGGKAENASPQLDYAIVLARNSTTGVCRLFACSFYNNNGGVAVPDLPTGYTTYYRVIGRVRTAALAAGPLVDVYQPLCHLNSTDAEYVRYDHVASGLAAATLQAAVDEVDAKVDAHISDTSAAHNASAIFYAGGAGMSATDVEAAIDELATEKLDIPTTAAWTPVLTFTVPGNLNVVYSTQFGYYYKVGKLVVLTFQVLTSTFTHTTATGVLRITGLPFAAQTLTDYAGHGAVQWRGITKAGFTDVVATVGSNTSELNFTISGSAVATSTVAFGDMPTGGTVSLRGTVLYVTA